MKNKKILLFLLVIMILGSNKVYASNTCYYANNDRKLLIKYDTGVEKFVIDKKGNTKNSSVGTTESLVNNGKSKKDAETDITVESVDGKSCPAYIVYRHNSTFFGSDGIFGFNDQTKANEFQSASANISKMSAWSLGTISYDEYKKNLTTAKSQSGSTNSYDIENNNIDCQQLFGDKSDPNSIRYLIDEILMYPKIIVPLIVIGFGILDLAKAVIAAKEDEMAKAKKTFVKRCIIGAAFFLIPIALDIIMGLADIVWSGSYTICN